MKQIIIEDELERQFSIHPRGTIVTLNTHPFFSQNAILIGGEPNLIPPFMIVSESLIDNKVLYDENTGNQISGKDSTQYKCLWYSHRSNQIEETWLSNRVLKVVSTVSEIDESQLSQLKIPGTLVTLKTMELESGKQKISLNQRGSINNDSSKTVTALLSFVPPIMQVIGTVKSETKEPLFDPKTNIRKRFIPRILVKCKYYNPQSDKMSEVLVPIEALSLVPTANDELIANLNKVITNADNLVRFNTPSDELKLLNLKRLIYKFGRYFVEYKNLMSNEFGEIEVNALSNIQLISDTRGKLPSYRITENILQIETINKRSIERLLNGINKENVFFIITYKDKHDNKSERTINDLKFVIQREAVENGEDGEVKDIDTIDAHCFLRGSRRFFRVDRIQKIELIDISQNSPL